MQKKGHLKLNCINNWDVSLDGSGDPTPFKNKNSLINFNLIFSLIPTVQRSYNTRSLDQAEAYYCRTDAVNKFFFPYTIVEWNKLDLAIRKSKSYAIFRNALLKIDWPNQCSIYRIHNLVGLNLLTRLRFGLSHPNKHRFNHNHNQSCINPICSCSLAIESTTHFLLHWHHFSNIYSTLLNSIMKF